MLIETSVINDDEILEAEVLSEIVNVGGGTGIPYEGEYSVTPSEVTQTLATADRYLNSDVVVDPIPSAYIVPEGVLSINANDTYDVTSYASAEVNVQPSLQSKYVTPSEEVQNVVADAEFDGLSEVTVEPIPSEYEVPIIYEGETNVKASITMPIILETEGKKVLSNITIETGVVLQLQSVEGFFADDGNPLDVVAYLDTRDTWNFKWLFRKQIALNSVAFGNAELPNFVTSNGRYFDGMFFEVRRLQSVANLDVTEGTTFNDMFNGDDDLVSVNALRSLSTIPSECARMFKGCSKLPSLSFTADSVTTCEDMFKGCYELSNLELNIWIDCDNLDLSDCPLSLGSIAYLSSADGLKSAEGIHQVAFGDNYAKLTEEQKSALLSRGIEAIVSFPLPPAPKEEQTKTISITENGTTEVLPDEGKVLSGVTVEVDVQSGGTVGKPYVDSSQLKSIVYMFSAQYGNPIEMLETIDTRNVENFSYAFQGREDLKAINFDTHNGKNFTYAFSGCPKIENTSGLDLSNAEICWALFHLSLFRCDLPRLETSKVTDFTSAFRYVLSETIESINMSSATKYSNMFMTCKMLKNITFEGIVPIFDDTFNMSDCPLTEASLTSLVNALHNKDGATHTITLGASNIAKLTEAQLQSIADKNINIQ